MKLFAVYAALPYNSPMVFIETSLFTRHVLKQIAKEIEDV
jgi:hypothetical protein